MPFLARRVTLRQIPFELRDAVLVRVDGFAGEEVVRGGNDLEEICERNVPSDMRHAFGLMGRTLIHVIRCKPSSINSVP